MNKKIYFILFLVVLSCRGYAQNYQFNQLKQTYIKGASSLTAPKFLKAGKGLVTIWKAGHAAPSVYDWDGDGKSDLLVGEFGSGKKSNLVVYRNLGTNKKPLYSPEWFYATDKSGELMYVTGS